jgi:putative ubiquitin-RnfH superfamily antitoxin RatB of RatAB toxin-antitoxin module
MPSVAAPGSYTVDPMSDETITIEVAYAVPHKQLLLELQVPCGTTALQAAQQSGIASKFPDVDLENVTLGIFGQIVAPGYTLRAGDRVEIYRPLIADPKDVRKARAERAKARKTAR